MNRREFGKNIVGGLAFGPLAGLYAKEELGYTDIPDIFRFIFTQYIKPEHVWVEDCKVTSYNFLNKRRYYKYKDSHEKSVSREFEWGISQNYCPEEHMIFGNSPQNVVLCHKLGGKLLNMFPFGSLEEMWDSEYLMGHAYQDCSSLCKVPNPILATPNEVY
tara:strand:+ start:35819 stop:36301 length:483 start_codon:yes stop_codon:yes gene_type:complete